jgi:hypothetical protein
MNIDPKLWQKTTITHWLSPFPGVVGEFLQKTTPLEIIRMEKYLPHIFWRWYMLENPSLHTNPYYALYEERIKEQWPQEGQFFPQPKMTIANKTAVQIDITVDYITFSEQPLIADVILALSQKEQKYHYDHIYDAARDYLVGYCQEKNITAHMIQKNPMQLLMHYFQYTLLVWYKGDQCIYNAFSKKEWFAFWLKMMKLGSRKDALSTDHLLDDFVDIVRNVYPDYGIKSAELELVNKSEDISINVKIQYLFWISLSYHVLVPLSLYTHLLAPIFVEEEMFQKDVASLISEEYSDPMPIYAPFTTLSVTPFGRKFLKECKSLL